jgi:hypothetical protein
MAGSRPLGGHGTPTPPMAQRPGPSVPTLGRSWHMQPPTGLQPVSHLLVAESRSAGRLDLRQPLQRTHVLSGLQSLRERMGIGFHIDYNGLSGQPTAIHTIPTSLLGSGLEPIRIAVESDVGTPQVDTDAVAERLVGGARLHFRYGLTTEEDDDVTVEDIGGVIRTTVGSDRSHLIEGMLWNMHFPAFDLDHNASHVAQYFLRRYHGKIALHQPPQLTTDSNRHRILTVRGSDPHVINIMFEGGAGVIGETARNVQVYDVGAHSPDGEPSLNLGDETTISWFEEGRVVQQFVLGLPGGNVSATYEYPGPPMDDSAEV